MRHTFASLLLERGAPITYVSRQLGHRDASITLRVYAHWLPDASRERLVDRLDAMQPCNPAQPRQSRGENQMPLSALESVVSRGGIEPPTRRLRVASRRSKSSKY